MGNTRELLLTKDGSHTVIVPSLDITYRSRHGALQESLHVFIDAGLKYKWSTDPGWSGDSEKLMHVFELGFGTGLNALLTAIEAMAVRRNISYTTIEPEPLEPEMAGLLNYDDAAGFLQKMHEAEWGMPVAINPYFTFTKYKSTFADFDLNITGTNIFKPGNVIEPGNVAEPDNVVESVTVVEPDNVLESDNVVETDNVNATGPVFDLVYFDAFGPLTQPELWSAESFTKVASFMKTGAVLTTYCSKSVVRKTMVSAGLQVKKIQGPYGKREIVRAIK